MAAGSGGVIDAYGFGAVGGGSAVRPDVAGGLNWLIQAVNTDSAGDGWPIGFYFAKLWYYEKLYPLIFTASALGRAVTLVAADSNPKRTADRTTT